MSGAHRLEIGRLRAACLVPAGHPRPETVRARVEEAAAGLAEALAPALAGLGEGEGVCLIRRLDLDVALDPGREPPALRRAWAAAVARAVAGRLAGDGDGVVRFPSRAGQLAHFLAHLAEGDAWSSWYHQPYEGLRALPVRAAMRTAILTDAGLGLEAVRSLGNPERARVIESLGEGEARRVLEGLASGDGPPRPGLLAEALPACPFGPTAPERAALALFAALPLGSGRADAALARSLAHARAAARRGEGDLPEAPAGGGLAAPAGADPAIAGPLLALSDDARRALLAAARAGETMPPPHLAWTPNGGLFLLLDALAALPDPEPGGWPEGPGMEAGPLLRLLVLASAAGPERAEEVFGDPVWRALFGLPPRLLAGDVEAWAAGVPPRAAGAWARRLHGLAGGPPEPAWPGLPGALRRAVGLGAAAVLRGFSRRLPGFAGSSAAYLRANFLGEGARVERTALRAEAVLARPTLDVVLAMSAVSDATLTLGWLRPPTIRIRRGP